MATMCSSIAYRLLAAAGVVEAFLLGFVAVRVVRGKGKD